MEGGFLPSKTTKSETREHRQSGQESSKVTRPDEAPRATVSTAPVLWTALADPRHQILPSGSLTPTAGFPQWLQQTISLPYQPLPR